MKLTAGLRTTLIACVACAIIPGTASAIPRLGDELALDTARFDSIEGFAASAGEGLVEDTRAVPSRGGALLLHRAGGVRWFSQRLDGAGVLSAPRELRLGGSPVLGVVRVAEDNGGMLAIFERWVSLDSRELLALRLDADGVARTTAAVTLGTFPRGAAERLDAACTANACTVAFFTASNELRLLRLDASGMLQQRALPVLAPAWSRFAVAASGTDTMVAVVETSERTRLISVDSAGVPRPSSVIAAYNSGEPRLVHDGFSFVLQYTRLVSMTPFVTEQRAHRLRDDGGEFVPARDALLSDSRSFGTYAMFRHGDVVRFIVSTSDRGPIRSVTFDRADVVSAPALWATERALTLEYGDSVLPLSSGHLVLQRRDFRLVAPGLGRLPVLSVLHEPDRSTRRIAPGRAAPQRSPRLVRDGSYVDVLWSESRDAAGQLFRRRFSADGTLSPTDTIPVVTQTLRPSCFDAVRSGGELFVNWHNALSRLGVEGSARVPASGAARSSWSFIGDAVWEATDHCPQLFDSGGLVTWAQFGARQFLVGRESSAGTFDARWDLFGGENRYPQYMAAFVTGAELEVHWRSDSLNRSARFSPSSLPERAATTSGPRTFGDPLRMIEAPAGRRLAVWRDGAWLAQRFDGSSAVDASASMLANPPSTTLSLDRSSIELARDRSSFYAAIVVGTSEGRALQISRVPVDGPWSVESVRVTPPGVDVEGWSMLVEADGRLRVAYGRHDPAFGTSRVFTREVLFDDTRIEQGSSCTRDAHCQSGACVDGVCCDRPCAGEGALCGACARATGAASDGVCSLVACAIAPVDASADAATDASVDARPTEDGAVRDARRPDVVSDRDAVDAGRDGSAPDADVVDLRLGGGCQCAVAAAGDRRASRGPWLLAASALAIGLARRRGRSSRRADG